MNRLDFIKMMTALPLGIGGIKEFYQNGKQMPDEPTLMPVLFIGHGSPMNAIQQNSFTESLKKTGEVLPTPKAIMVVSAHWLTKGTFVTVSENPKIIYDFYGFPKEMYEVDYPVNGSKDYGLLTAALPKEQLIMPDHEWGIDHGVWTVLMHMFPLANIPVYQLSIDYKLSLAKHYELAGMLKELRKKGVLVIGSGNITHNLRDIDWNINAKPFDWAEVFDSKIKAAIESGNHIDILEYEKWGTIAKQAHPSNDHFLPLLYSLGLTNKGESISYIYEGFHHGSLSMRCVKFG